MVKKMKIVSIILVAFIYPFLIFSQPTPNETLLSGTRDSVDTPSQVDKSHKKDTIKVDSYPETDMIKLYKSVVYPVKCVREGIQGDVIVKVLVGTDGKVKDLKIERSDNDLLNQTALDVVSQATFKPAMSKGMAVEVWTSIPIHFRLK